MGIRETQLFGLTEDAKQFLRENCNKVTTSTCPQCGYILSEGFDSKIYDDKQSLGMFEDGPLLKEYILKDSTTAKEIVQASPWSSGPCIFLCLELDGEKKFEWSQEDIDNC